MVLPRMVLNQILLIFASCLCCMEIVLFFTWLTPPQANDRHLEAAGQTEVFRKHPCKASILNMPLVTTLFYS
jgi:hypothetical protein